MQGLVVVEGKRGCGYRKPAKDGVGIYLVGPAAGAPCGRLPFALGACPVCGGGVHAARGWTWIEPRKLFGVPVTNCGVEARPVAPEQWLQHQTLCLACPMGFDMPEGRHGLIWIGEMHYKTPQAYLEEAQKMGLSRKLKAVPKGFKLGETVVYLAHRFAVPNPKLKGFSAGALAVVPGDATELLKEPPMLPGVFSTFMPTGIDLVVADAEHVPERAAKLAEQIGDGARVIQVVQAEAVQQAELSGLAVN